jgi:hypothetical protein
MIAVGLALGVLALIVGVAHHRAIGWVPVFHRSDEVALSRCSVDRLWGLAEG